ncbi:hypothetical protein LXA43DRAFT_1027049, partial [Ganoderma leucocontextum]
MSNSANTFFRAGYVTSLDAWKRYLADGHNIHFRARDDTEADEDSSDDEDEDADGDEDEDEEEQQISRPPISEEERTMLEESEARFRFISRSRGTFRGLYRRAPLEVRTRIVLPHSFTRIVKLPQGGKFYEWNMFIPTGWSGASMRTRGPSNVDRERIQTFIDGANSLIKDDARREAGGFTLSEPDFKFDRVPDSAVTRPLLSAKELKDLVNVGPESAQLWGLTPREFLRPYYQL